MIQRLRGTLPYPIVCVLGLLAIAHARHGNVQPSPSYGCCTARQILERSERLCRALVPQPGRLRLKAEHTGEIGVPLWTVEVSDDAGVEIGNLAWDAATGNIARASLYFPPSRTPIAGKRRWRTDRELMHIAWSWMQTVGIAEQAPRWRHTLGPVRTGKAATVVWKAESRVARIQINVWTGDLLVVDSWPCGATPPE